MITSITASILGFMLVWISFETIKGRWKYKISLGSGTNNEILHLTSAHSNFISYSPYFLILLYLAERENSVPNLFLIIISSAFIIGRFLHFITSHVQVS
jgi:uncharacterized membrane protein YecN with MAPEG domain